ncbi:Methyltransferase domain-containing protein [Reichenbachiella faecimaris]|uniref:Methyltransferase domain-containing protein n=1 Tax=Reichenbachiella faecimaris TaxID=692418 RepID=A0A1W2G8M8_REIFA|nr:SAM-dependent methyltransferase [Reichenbachiella faecimaris]SMD33045.1 Methyltransferase domain-containing protein [Reichenbachiella faecimaris]
MNSIEEFVGKVREAVSSNQFNKLTLSKPRYKSNGLQNIFIRLVDLKGLQKLSFNYRHLTKDLTKNFDLEKGLVELELQLTEKFKHATLLDRDATWQLMINKKGKVTIISSQPIAANPLASHDKEKEKRAPLDAPYLHELGITTDHGALIPKMADKYRQINKYLEIMDHQIETNVNKKVLNLVDMGSGKGYLTFALYDFLWRIKGFDVSVTGIELRQELVDFCNEKAKRCGFEKLQFINQRIEDFQTKHIDILIALHACDTATDDALAKAIAAQSELIVCAPCCHKQVRQQVKGKLQESPLLKYGIFQERHFEMVTDTIRALILEQQGYQSKVFEFVSNEHTRKNIMLVGAKSKHTNAQQAKEKIDALKKEYHIDFQYLEQLV